MCCLSSVVIVALGFDFTNGFHDTGNAMATSIATKALSPRVAVGLSGALNLAGAFLSLAVAATIASGLVDTNSRGEPAHHGGPGRDPYRHPKQTLLFFGIRPGMRVLQVWPEPGWYTEIIAPLLRPRGSLYAGVIAPDPGSRFLPGTRRRYAGWSPPGRTYTGARRW